MGVNMLMPGGSAFWKEAVRNAIRTVGGSEGIDRLAQTASHRRDRRERRHQEARPCGADRKGDDIQELDRHHQRHAALGEEAE